MSATTTRKSAEERREDILAAAAEEFAEHGLHGASTDAIARGAGISQPYLFRLFGTKKDLYVASVERCLGRTLEAFRDAADGKHGPEALAAIGEAYAALLEDRTMLRGQMQAYAACDDPDVCEVVRRGYGELVRYVQRVAPGIAPEDLRAFFAQGMLYNVIAAMRLTDAQSGWVADFLAGCKLD